MKVLMEFGLSASLKPYSVIVYTIFTSSIVWRVAYRVVSYVKAVIVFI